MTEEIAEILDAVPVEDPDGLDRSIPESRRPALRKLSMDIEQLVSELSDGFETREECLQWSRRSIPRTLGEIPTRWFVEFSKQFRRDPATGGERTLLAAMLTPEARRRDLDEDGVEELRTRLAVEIIEPAYHRAFRQLRTSATEYIDDETGGSAHDPNKQRYIAMRPALDEFARYQRVALDALLDGLQSADGIRQWGEMMELATHGELQEGFIATCIQEQTTRSLLVEDDPSPAQESARELFAATFLLPAFNRGMRDLRNKSKEEPDSEKTRKSVPSL